MAIDVIPTGSSAVIADDNDACDIIWAVKDAEADTVRTVKDAEAQLSKQIGDDYADTVKTVKDSEAQLGRQVGMQFADTLRTVKDSESALHKDLGDKFINVVQDVKDAESRLMKDAGDKFINLVQDVKDAESRLMKDAGDKFIDTIQDIKTNGFETERVVRTTAYDTERSLSQTREALFSGFKGEAVKSAEYMDKISSRVERGNKEILVNQLEEFRKIHDLEWNLFNKLERQADFNAHASALAAKDQALLSERLAGKQELLSEKLYAKTAAQMAECCCEMKQLVSAEGQKTRDLVNVQEHERLRDRANKAEAQLAAYFAAKVTPVVP